MNCTRSRESRQTITSRFHEPDEERHEGCEQRGGICDCSLAGKPCFLDLPSPDRERGGE